DAALDDGDLARLDVEHAELRADREPPLLRDDEQLAVGVIEEAPFHRARGDIDVRGHAAVAADGDQAVDEVDRLGRDRKRIPRNWVWGAVPTSQAQRRGGA